MTKTKFEFLTDIDMAEFISKRAHDLRSPYNHVIGFTKMVLNGQSGPLTDLQKEDLSTAYKSSMRTLWLMNNLIDIARLSRNEKALTLAEVDVNQMLDQVIAQWKKFNPDKGNLIASMVMTSSPMLKVDELQTRQILTGYISYMVEYMQPGAGVTITVEDESDWWLMTIEATGNAKDHFSEVDLEMTGYISGKFLELAGGEVRDSGLDEGRAYVKFGLPK